MDFIVHAVEFVFRLTDLHFIQGLLIQWGWLAYPLLFSIVFSETGLLIGFFLPGDSLLFVAGFVASQGHLEIALLNLLLMSAAIIGDSTGYLLGKKTGPKIFHRKDSFLFRKDHLIRTQAFYERHGGKTIVMARFVPIVRTFAPFVAGVGNMNYSRFLLFNVCGGIGWVLAMTLAGYFFGNICIVKQNFEAVVVLIIVASVLPLFWHALAHRNTKGAGSQ